MTYALLASDDPRIADLIADWPSFQMRWQAPRAEWLHRVESILRELHPTANSDSLTYTARTLAPFPLALPGVP